MMPHDQDDAGTSCAKSQRVVLPPKRRPSQLVQEQGPGAPATLVLEGVELIVGRGADADIHLSHESLSRKHARLRRRGIEYIIDDLDSTNGVWINGIRVHSVTLCHGDTLQLGDLVFRYEEGD